MQTAFSVTRFTRWANPRSFLSGHHVTGRRRTSWGICEALDIAFGMHGFTVFIGAQIGLQIYGAVTKYAGNLREGAATHNTPPLEGYE